MSQLEKQRKKEHLARKLKALRAANAWTQPELAEKLDVSPGVVGNWESERVFPYPRNIKKLAYVFGVPAADFFPPEQSAEEYPPHQASRVMPSESEAEITAASDPTVKRLRAWLESQIRAAGEDSARLGWLLVELQRKFPQDLWPLKHDDQVEKGER